MRFTVLYRLGGRGTPQLSAGTFKTWPEAEAVLGRVRSAIAGGEEVPRAERHEHDGRERQVYFVRFADRIKIGIAVDPEKRARDLHGDLLVTMPGGRRVERRLHRLFAEDRIRGEWFEASPQILEYIRDRLDKRRWFNRRTEAA